MTLEEIIHVFEHSRLVTDCFKQEAVTEAYVEALAALRAQQAEQKNGTLKTTWETPDACPHCMEHLSREWSFCPECGRPTDWSENAPLTLDELREMDGEPVWCEMLIKGQTSFYGIVHGNMVTGYRLRKPNPINLEAGKTGGYGLAWLAYRRKPEGGRT